MLLYLGSIEVFSAGETKLLRAASECGWNVVACTIGVDFLADQKIIRNDRGATRLASRVDNHLADRAYAMEAMLAYLEQQQPELLAGPRVIAGTSAGAIALPTVVARIGPVDAAVLIGGGENVAQIILESPLLNQHIELVEEKLTEQSAGKFKLSWEPCTDPQLRSEFANRVLQKSKIDPHYAAAALVDTPVLMLQAKYDSIVPALTGQSLYESLGRPQRWSYRTGHVGLTLLVPWKIGYVLDWMATQTAGL